MHGEDTDGSGGVMLDTQILIGHCKQRGQMPQKPPFKPPTVESTYDGNGKLK